MYITVVQVKRHESYCHAEETLYIKLLLSYIVSFSNESIVLALALSYIS